MTVPDLKILLPVHIAADLGAMQQGFKREFVARAHRSGCRSTELPDHSLRASGVTPVYEIKMPGILFRYVSALLRIHAETPVLGGHRSRYASVSAVVRS
jgi:hypothetical protein